MGDRHSVYGGGGTLRAALPDLDRRKRNKQIEIVNSQEWYHAGDKLAPRELVLGLVRREQEALGGGYAGLRTNGNCAWVSPDQWADFLAYEGLVQEASAGRRMISMCSYCIDQLHDGAHWQILHCHDLAVPGGRHASAADAGAAITEPQQLRAALARQKRAFDVAMTASRMGTWRYALADNICVR